MGAVIIARLKKDEGKFQFRFQVLGEKMSVIELWFYDKVPWAIYATLAGVAIFILLIFIWMCVCCH